MPGDCFGQVVIVASSKLYEFAETDEIFLEVAAEEKAAEVIGMFGGTGDAIGFGGVLFGLGIYPIVTMISSA